mmetsp:Transcript_33770/g.41414  ORF Transcript_33770/g.41414 Transcript_33770/m.41414 type:complete len:308 (+) Transcript_33770:70-993(+)|eukprot:CAMPEP_0172497780 /NCGR_PEP_ID=MMETSP1066-20121228/105178_1 /TAXON_ID=671091 /ORGANISM="Coscinodiscus wailesii, Strain CCMP2513" /LENGTH=307 /DNA_ID=CAMNT_0013270747 /DNA_START=61 /DNA_END=984 /DNA_ORIENTATION=+
MIRQRSALAFLLLAIQTSNGFVVPNPSNTKTVFGAEVTRSAIRTTLQLSKNDKLESFDPLGLSSDTDFSDDSWSRNALIASAATAAWLASPLAASAAGPDWGIFEGKTGSLLHPVSMASMFVFSVYTAFLGFQWRRQRTIGDEISALKKTLPKFDGSSLSDAIAALESAEEVDTYKVNALKLALPIQADIDSLIAERKELSSQGNKDKHFSQGALLAFIGTFFAIEGPLNTYARAGKLFPGPHLYAGAALVVLWALAAACVPAMQKGSETARTIHIGANVAGIGMFAWQVQSGIPILLKVWEKTSWP